MRVANWYVTDSVHAAEIHTKALRDVAATGRDQAVHFHGYGYTCSRRCYELTPEADAP